MGTPDNRTSERHIQLGRGILRALRKKRNDQWIDIHRLINETQLFEFFGEIARGEIDTSATYINRENATGTANIETKTNEETSVQYIKSNSDWCIRKNPKHVTVHRA